ncbi:MFS transporter [Terribacillus saccharophilus]|uniref:MFS transporter n=1 Tax=Terribacillus saccharophilus TaxID=361277 RepID=UPI002DCB983B|nr:MFS transporter [Terribacillus saccharophilus]
MLLHNHNFRMLLVSSIFSSCSISMYLLIEQWYVVNELGVPKLVGAVLLATTLPRVIFMFVGGMLADRLRKSRIIFFSLLTRSILMLLAALLAEGNLLHFLPLLFFAVTFGISDAFFWPARDSIITQLIPEEHLTKANAYMQTISQLGVVLGPPVAAMLLSYFSYSMVFAIIFALLLFSSLCQLTIKEPRKVVITESITLQIQEALQYIKTSPILRLLMLTFVIDNLLYIGPLMLSIPLFAESILAGDAFILSFLQISFSGGIIIGGILLGFLTIKKQGRWITAVLLGEGILLGLYSQSRSFILSSILLCLLGICVSAINVPVISLIQRVVPKHLTGRVLSVSTLVSIGLVPLSYGLVSLLLIANISIVSILIVSSLSIVIFSSILIIQKNAFRKI